MLFWGGEPDHSSKYFPHSWGSKVQFAPQNRVVLEVKNPEGPKSLLARNVFMHKKIWVMFVGCISPSKNLKRIKIHLSEFQLYRNQVLRPQKPRKHGFEI